MWQAGWQAQKPCIGLQLPLRPRKLKQGSVEVQKCKGFIWFGLDQILDGLVRSSLVWFSLARISCEWFFKFWSLFWSLWSLWSDKTSAVRVVVTEYLSTTFLRIRSVKGEIKVGFRRAQLSPGIKNTLIFTAGVILQILPSFITSLTFLTLVQLLHTASTHAQLCVHVQSHVYKSTAMCTPHACQVYCPCTLSAHHMHGLCMPRPR